jgi:hypothetical protein
MTLYSGCKPWTLAFAEFKQGEYCFDFGVKMCAFIGIIQVSVRTFYPPRKVFRNDYVRIDNNP